MSAMTDKLPDFMADVLQGVLFISPGQPQDDALKIWESLFPGQSPDGFQRTANHPTLDSHASGEREGFQLQLNVQVGRIDVVVSATAHFSAPLNGPPRIKEVEKAAQFAAGLLKRLAATLKWSRLALVLELSRTVPVGQEGNELGKHLTGFPIPADATDVVIQFNARKSFDHLPGCQMNRLCNWSSGQIGVIAGGPGAQGMINMTPYIGCKIDVNTVVGSHFSADSSEVIINELLNEALAIKAEGVKRVVK